MTKLLHIAVIAASALSLATAMCLEIGNAQSAKAQSSSAQPNGAKSGLAKTDVPQKPLWRRLSPTRTSPYDLELGGDIYNLLPHAARNLGYITRAQLLALPQVSYTVTNDANFTGPTEITGVALDELIGNLTPRPQVILVVAICSDNYEAHYPQAYMEAHHPVLVLKINGKDPAEWPKAPGSNANMGPYLISSPDFKPSFKILSYEDEPQIPWGVVRLEARTEAAVFHAIRPRMPGAASREVQDGYRIAKQNCFRCHNSKLEGGRKAQLDWTVLAAFATATPEFFQRYIRDPKSTNPNGSQMPSFPNYDEATLRALTKYFQTFADEANHKKP
jgi:mono/diheme cytochrome c family protein